MSKLRLVHPPGQQPPRAPRGRRSPALSLTADEVRRLRIAIKNTARAYGGLDVLASVCGLSHNSMESALYARKHQPSAALALLVARAAGVHLEAILSGQISEINGRCKACGARLAGGAR